MNNSIVIIIKKRIGGKYATLLLLWNLQKTWTRFFSKSPPLTLSPSNGCSCHFVRFQQVMWFWRYFNGECENKYSFRLILPARVTYRDRPIYNQQWNVFSVFDPSKCTHTWSSGHTHTHTHKHLEQWTHTHTHLEQWTHTHTLGAVDTHTWSSGHTHTPGAVDTHTHTHTLGAVDTHTHTHLEQWTHTHRHTWSSGHTHTHTHTLGAVDTHTHTWSSGHTHTHLEQWRHTHTPGAVETHTHTLHVTLYKIHSFETRWIILIFTIEPLFRQ